MTLSTQKVLDVARQQAYLRENRYDGYRIDIVRCLSRVIATQTEGTSEKVRREKVSKEVEALGQKVAAKAEGAGR